MRLTKGQILRLVNDYIGVSNGYLGQPYSQRFTYRSHREFYSVYCELDSIDPDSMEGTTREKFIAILLNANPKDQAKIIRGVFKKFPAHCTIEDRAALAYGNCLTDWGIELSKRNNIQDEYLKFAEELESNSLNVISNIVDSETALKALKDAQILLKENGAQSAIDRIHTTFHAFLISICKKNQFTFNNDDPITKIFKTIKENHPSFIQNPQEKIEKITRSIAT